MVRSESRESEQRYEQMRDTEEKVNKKSRKWRLLTNLSTQNNLGKCTYLKQRGGRGPVSYCFRQRLGELLELASASAC